MAAPHAVAKVDDIASEERNKKITEIGLNKPLVTMIEGWEELEKDLPAKAEARHREVSFKTLTKGHS